MTQRIFDVENEKDMALLWSILPDWAEKIKKSSQTYNYDMIFSDNENYAREACIFKINWHDKTEITRPVDYESMIGCVGWFWDNDETTCTVGELVEYKSGEKFQFINGNNRFKNFRPAKKSELKFWGE